MQAEHQSTVFMNELKSLLPWLIIWLLLWTNANIILSSQHHGSC